MADRIATLKADAAKLEAATSVLVVGGGLTGVELAAEVAGRYNTVPGTMKKVYLVTSKERLLPELKPEAAQYAHDYLVKHGVEVILNDRVPDTSPLTPAYFGPVKTVTTERGVALAVDATFSCVGYKANGAVITGSSGPISSSASTLADGYSNVFCAGDCLAHSDAGSVLPALGSADVAAQNVVNLERGAALVRFPQAAYGVDAMPRVVCCSLYKDDAVMQMKGKVLTGGFPAKLKMQTENDQLKLHEEGAFTVASQRMQKAAMFFVLRNFISN